MMMLFVCDNVNVNVRRGKYEEGTTRESFRKERNERKRTKRDIQKEEGEISSTNSPLQKNINLLCLPNQNTELR